MTPKPLFGGKGKKPLPWHPLPYAQEWVDGIESNSVRQVAHSAMAHFGMFCKIEDIRHPEELERRHVLHYQAYLTTAKQQHNGQPLSAGYQYALLLWLRTWLKWLDQKGYITQTPWEGITLRKAPKHSKPINADDIATIFEAHRRTAFKAPPFFFHRRETILTILYGWGLSLSEMLALNVPNVDMRQDFVVIRFANGTRSRSLPYGAEMKGVIARWLSQRAYKALPTEDALLIDSRGGRMTQANVRQVLSDLGNQAGVNLHPSRLRDTFGYNLLDRGVATEIVMGFLGHTRKAHVLEYDPKARELKKIHDELIETDLTQLLGHRRPITGEHQ